MVIIVIFELQPQEIARSPHACATTVAAQEAIVEWFRFWLQDYEDPSPAKAEQYKRWRELRALRAENKKNSGTTRAVF